MRKSSASCSLYRCLSSACLLFLVAFRGHFIQAKETRSWQNATVPAVRKHVGRKAQRAVRPQRGSVLRNYDQSIAYVATSDRDELLTLAIDVKWKDGGGAAVPIGRSYEGNQWEAVPPLHLKFNCDSESSCNVRLPESHEGGSVSHYIYESMISDDFSAEERAARLLIQGTFGPTAESISIARRMDPEDWIADQMEDSRYPPTLHREHYRRRANQRLNQAAGQGRMGVRSPCDRGSRWNRFAFTNQDIGKEITTEQTRSGRWLVSVNGLPRTEMERREVQSLINSSVSPPHIICGVFELVGGDVAISSPNASNMCREDFIVIDNVPIRFNDGVPSTIGSIPGASLEDISPKVMDSKILRTQLGSGNCQFAGSGPAIVLATGTKDYYAHDPRVEFMDASPGSNDSYPSSALASSIAECPKVPKTFLNQDTCQPMRGDCSGPQYDLGTQVTLNADTLKRFYDLDARYVYVIKGFSLENVGPPCTKGKHRWVRYKPGSDTGGCPGGDTAINENLRSRLVSDISRELNKRTSEIRATVQAIDVFHRSVQCAESRFALGARLSVGSYGCWTHSNPSEMGVYDASFWVLEHPGNNQAFKGFRYNPIARIAENNAVGTTVEDNVTLNFPSWHPIDRFKPIRWTEHYLGGFGDSIEFAGLPQTVQGPGMAKYLGAILAGNRDDAFEFCGSYGEVSNDPRAGHHYNNYYAADQSQVTPHSLDQDHRPMHSKSMVWTSIAMSAPDQFRQRFAWALSQIFVISTDGLDLPEYTEPWVTYYDIFTRHAFGKFGDVLKEVSYSPMMGEYLTYRGSKSFQDSFERTGEAVHPDENFAREIMQLFTIGLSMLNGDGTEVLDQDGNPVETYTNEDIVTFARAWTGFEPSATRSNVETKNIALFGTNGIDPMNIPEGRDVFPKLGLEFGGGEDRRYIGDRVQRCSSLPRQAYLLKGATYRYLGSSSSPELSRGDLKRFEKKESPHLVLDPVYSSLYSALCGSNRVGGSCRFKSVVILEENLPCFGTCSATTIGGRNRPCECSIDQPRVVRLDNSAQTGSRYPVYYEYVRQPCVELAFKSKSSDLMAVSETGPDGKAMCAEADLPLAGTACCDRGNNRLAQSVCVFFSERVSYETAANRCESMGKTLCPWQNLQTNNDCGTTQPQANILGPARRGLGLQFQWTNSPCRQRLKVDHEGNVAIIHEASELNREVVGRTSENGATDFAVLWAGDRTFPKASNRCSRSCTVSGLSCVCDFEVVESIAFNGANGLPSRQTLQRDLYIGAPNPDLFERGTYSKCVAPRCIDLERREGVTLFTRTARPINQDSALRLDGNSIFGLVKEDGTRKVEFLTNLESTVRIIGGKWSFRNPPMFGSAVDQAQRDSIYETDAVLNHYLEHPNVPPFIATRLIQLLITSNPSSRYVEVVATAFKTGFYTSPKRKRFGRGLFGDLSATAAAIFLDSEARALSLDYDGMHGRAREPLLKVIHFLRAMRLEADEERELNLPALQDKIGQEAHHAPSVFSFFLPDFQPVGPVLEKGLVSPESQILDAPQIMSYINGISSTPNFGLTDCMGGFGSNFERYNLKDTKQRQRQDFFNCNIAGNGNPRTPKAPLQLHWVPSRWDPATVVSELDLLLTGGKLSPRNRKLIEDAYLSTQLRMGHSDALEVAQSLLGFSPEFHTTNHLLGTSTLRESNNNIPLVESRQTTKSLNGYKAVVYIFLQGGADSFSTLVPLRCSNDLFSSYTSVRGNMALDRNSLLPINDRSGTQPCSQFGVHSALGTVKNLYDDGDAVFLANVGNLVGPTTKQDVLDKLNVPPNLFAHNTQQKATQSVHAQNPRASGVLGRIGDALNFQAGDEKVFSAYSTRGSPKIMEGAPGVSQAADVLSSNGVSGLSFLSSKMEEGIRSLNAPKLSSIYGETYSEKVSDSLNRMKHLGDTISQKTLVNGSWHLPAERPSCCSSDICKQLQQVARLINSRDILDATRDSFFVQQNRYDTHNNNGPQLESLLAELDEALKCFADELKAQRIWNDVTVVTSSDFGRTLKSNGQGTDHGWGGNYFLLGGGLKGGRVLGEFPSDLSDSSPVVLQKGRVLPTTPWDSVWNGIAEWMGLEKEGIESVLPNLKKFPESTVLTKQKLYI